MAWIRSTGQHSHEYCNHEDFKREESIEWPGMTNPQVFLVDMLIIHLLNTAYPKYEWIKNDWRTKAQLKPSVGLAITNIVSILLSLLSSAKM